MLAGVSWGIIGLTGLILVSFLMVLQVVFTPGPRMQLVLWKRLEYYCKRWAIRRWFKKAELENAHALAFLVSTGVSNGTLMCNNRYTRLKVERCKKLTRLNQKYQPYFRRILRITPAPI